MACMTLQFNKKLYSLSTLHELNYCLTVVLRLIIAMLERKGIKEEQQEL